MYDTKKSYNYCTNNDDDVNTEIHIRARREKKRKKIPDIID